MVRIVVTEMMEKCPHAGKKHSTVVGKEMVAKYPKSLQDVIEGDVVGTGYHSLVKQLQNRIENVRRNSTPKLRKRKHPSESDSTDEFPLEERAAMQDTYGCIQWNVKFLPIEETQESQQQKMEKLKVMFQHCNVNPEEVKCLMKSTFYTQRQHVNQGKSIKCLREEWPFMFDELGMSVHFKELTGIDLKETFTRNLDLKGKRLLDYMTTVCVNKSKKFTQNYARLQRLRGPQSGSSDDVIEMLLLLLSYFDEKEESMFYHVEDTRLAEEVPLDQVPLTPTLIVCGKFPFFKNFFSLFAVCRICHVSAALINLLNNFLIGQSCYSSTRYMLSLDRNLTNTNISSFIPALCLMFGSFYCFNIHYPSELASTLEFLQR